MKILSVANHELNPILVFNVLKNIAYKPESHERHWISMFSKFGVLKQGDVPCAGYADGQPFESFSDVVLFGDHTLSLYSPRGPFLLASDGIKILKSAVLSRDFYIVYWRYINQNQKVINAI